jgi:hypothetical protein
MIAATGLHYILNEKAFASWIVKLEMHWGSRSFPEMTARNCGLLFLLYFINKYITLLL